MTRVALVAATLAALTGTASAGYIGLGIGSVPAVSDDQPYTPTSRSAKVLVGSRWGRFSLEGALGGFEVGVLGSTTVGKLYQFSAAAKLNLPLGDNFEAFGRFGLGHSRAVIEDDYRVYEARGNGFLVSAGLEYRLDVGVAGASAFIDYQINNADLTYDSGQQTASVTSRMFSLGATLGF